MSSVEKRIREAFDSITMPPDLKEKTLAMLEHEAKVCNEASPSSKDRVSAAATEFKEDTEKPCCGYGERSDAKRPSPGSLRRSIAANVRRMRVAIAACLALVAMGFGGFTAYATETASINIECNPSIELGINRFDAVVASRALNEEGQRVLDEAAVMGKNYEEALASLMDGEVLRSFIVDGSFIDIYVACDDDSQASTLMVQSNEALATLPCAGVCSRASLQDREDAANAGMGIARYEAIRHLIELDPSVTLDEAKTMMMRELRSRIAELDPESAYARGGQGQQQGQGAGQQQGQGAGQQQGQDQGKGKDQEPGQRQGQGKGQRRG